MRLPRGRQPQYDKQQRKPTKIDSVPDKGGRTAPLTGIFAAAISICRPAAPGTEAGNRGKGQPAAAGPVPDQFAGGDKHNDQDRPFHFIG